MNNYFSIYQMFTDTASKFKDKKYVIFDGKSYTYFEAEKIINQTARVLSSHGVKKGTKVIVMLSNSPEFIFTSFAVFALGGVLIPINVFFKDSEATYIINDSEAEFVITSAQFESVITPSVIKCPRIKQVFSYDNGVTNTINLYTAIQGMGIHQHSNEVTPDDLAMFIYTSGTTGHPKGAMLTHFNIIQNLHGFIPVLGATSKDRFLVMLPMFHTYTFTVNIMGVVYLGASCIILESVMDMKKKNFKSILIFQRPTLLLAVPQVFAALVKSPMPDWFIRFVYPIRMHVSGGAALPMEVFEQFKKKFGRPVIEGYGLSEASPAVSFNPLTKQKPGTIGVPIINVLCKVIDSEEVEVARGQVGELIVKGPNVMQGYWHMPKATDDAIKNGWLFTGDLATIDDENYITIVDRKKDLIITKGMNVYPREIEEVIYTFPNVDAVAVIGLPTAEQEETIHAYVQPKPNQQINEVELRKYLKKELANFKQPKTIHIIDNIPLTATGKVLKRVLKEMIKEGKIK